MWCTTVATFLNEFVLTYTYAAVGVLSFYWCTLYNSWKTNCRHTHLKQNVQRVNYTLLGAFDLSNKWLSQQIHMYEFWLPCIIFFWLQRHRRRGWPWNVVAVMISATSVYYKPHVSFSAYSAADLETLLPNNAKQENRYDLDSQLILE